MKAPQVKLFGPKQIVLIITSSLAGIGFFLFRRYYENGKLGLVELISTLLTIAMVVAITVFIVRKARRED